MADQNGNTVPRGLWLNGSIWYFAKTIKGHRVRATTHCSDLQSAIRVAATIEANACYESAGAWWAQEIARARQGDAKSCLVRMHTAAKHRSKNRGMPFMLTLAQLIAMAEWNTGRCAVSGMEFSPLRVGKRRPFYPSLDRIDCNEGYAVHNCRIVCLLVNYAMNEFGAEPFLMVARRAVLRELETSSMPSDSRIDGNLWRDAQSARIKPSKT